MLNKKLGVALVVAAAAMPVVAQSSVQIYGRINTTLEQQKLGGQQHTGIFNNSSRIGFKGVEALDQGLKAGFALESSFASDTGAGTEGGVSFDRQSEVFLQSSAGMLRLGNFSSESLFATADMVSLHNHDTGSSSDALYAYTTRESNKIAYRTPVVANTWVEVAHAFHEKQSGQKNVWDVAANYQAGALGLGAGFTDNGFDRQLAVRATYQVGAWVVAGYAQRVALDRGTTEQEKWSNYRLAAAYTLGANELHANLGYADREGGKSATQWTLGVNHHLSKQSKLYAYYTKVDNSANANYGYGFNPGLQSAIGSQLGQDFSAVAVGVRHNF